MTYFKAIELGGKGQGFAFDFGQQSLQIFAGEGPAEGGSTAFVVGLKSKQAFLELGQGTEVIGGQNFSLNDRQVDLDLVEPTGVDRSVDQNGIGPLGAETVSGLLPAMSGTFIYDPEDPAGGAWFMTSLTRRSTGPMPFLLSQRPKTLARWTSHAVK